MSLLRRPLPPQRRRPSASPTAKLPAPRCVACACRPRWNSWNVLPVRKYGQCSTQAAAAAKKNCCSRPWLGIWAWMAPLSACLHADGYTTAGRSSAGAPPVVFNARHRVLLHQTVPPDLSLSTQHHSMQHRVSSPVPVCTMSSYDVYGFDQCFDQLICGLAAKWLLAQHRQVCRESSDGGSMRHCSSCCWVALQRSRAFRSRDC